jgi:hypothetical protein
MKYDARFKQHHLPSLLCPEHCIVLIHAPTARHGSKHLITLSILFVTMHCRIPQTYRQRVHLSLDTGYSMPTTDEVEHKRDISPSERDSRCNRVISHIGYTRIVERDQTLIQQMNKARREDDSLPSASAYATNQGTQHTVPK